MGKKAILFIMSLLLLAGGVGSFGVYLWYSFGHSSGSSERQDVVYEVKPGTSFRHIARELQSRNVINNADFFWLYARILGLIGKVKMGEYALHTQMTPAQVIDILTSGKSIERSFTVAEGLNIFEISKLYELQGFGTASEFLRWSRDPSLVNKLLGSFLNGKQVTSLEGYLFPETYRLSKFTTTEALLEQMVQNFLKAFKEVVANVNDTERPANLDRHQFVTLASVVEKETGAPQERPLIASVFFNRLQKNMKLQTDPTVLYAKALETGTVEQNITRVDLAMDHPYNTYMNYGLPPGPISNPGREAMKAVLAPTQSDYLYFVSQNNGTHVFSADYKQHEKAVQEFQLKRSNREGHSWRELRNRSTGTYK